MALNCGIVGLPNVGKSTIFSALSHTQAEAANYPFCTINPNTGIVNVPDTRLSRLSALFSPKKTIPAAMEFVDIAGLVKGASKGEGLGNQFLSHIREVGIIAHVVRCFEDADIVHVHNKVDPLSDIETVNIELALADLQTLAKRRERAERSLKVQSEKKKTEEVLVVLDKIEAALEGGKAAREAALERPELLAVQDCHFITLKPALFVCNTDEEGARSAAEGKPNQFIADVQKKAAAESSAAVVICGKFEAELAGIEDEDERSLFLRELGLKTSGLDALVHAAYSL